MVDVMFIPQHFVCIKKHTRKPTCVFSKSRLEFHLFPAVHPQDPANASSQKDRGQPGGPSRCEKSPLQHQRDTSDTTSEKQSTGSSQQSPLLPHQQRCRQTAQKHGRTHNRRGYHRKEGSAGKLPHPSNHQRGNCQNRSSCRCGHHNRQKNPFQFLHIHDLPSYFWYINMSSKEALGQKKRRRCTRLLKSPPERTTF